MSTLIRSKFRPYFTQKNTKWICKIPSNISKEDVGSWQIAIKLMAKLNQDFKCSGCKNSFRANQKLELHHALISREDVRGLSFEFYALIHHTYNCLLLHHECHLQLNRENSWRLLSEIYGQDNLVDWYESLPNHIMRPKVTHYI